MNEIKPHSDTEPSPSKHRSGWIDLSKIRPDELDTLVSMAEKEIEDSRRNDLPFVATEPDRVNANWWAPHQLAGKDASSAARDLGALYAIDFIDFLRQNGKPGGYGCDRWLVWIVEAMTGRTVDEFGVGFLNGLAEHIGEGAVFFSGRPGLQIKEDQENAQAAVTP